MGYNNIKHEIGGNYENKKKFAGFNITNTFSPYAKHCHGRYGTEAIGEY